MTRAQVEGHRKDGKLLLAIGGGYQFVDYGNMALFRVQCKARQMATVKTLRVEVAA